MWYSSTLYALKCICLHKIVHKIVRATAPPRWQKTVTAKKKVGPATFCSKTIHRFGFCKPPLIVIVLIVFCASEQKLAR